MTAAANGTDAYLGGSGSPLVLLHGINLSWRVWQPVLGMLEDQHAVFAPTLPGHRGAAPLPPDAARGMAGLADALETRLDAAGIDRAHLAGNSLGGALALELAQRERARSVVAFAPAGAFSSQWDRRRLIWLLRFGARMSRSSVMEAALRVPVVRRYALRQAVERADRIPLHDIQRVLADTRGCTAREGLLAALREGAPAAEFAIDPQCPVRIAWPLRDRTIPFRRYGRPLVRAFTQAEFVPLPGVGHVPTYDNPRLVADTILGLTTRVDEPGTDDELSKAGQPSAEEERSPQQPRSQQLATLPR